MPKEVGLTARLKFLGGAAVAGMRAAGQQFSSMSMAAQKLKQGVADIRQGMTQLSMVGVATAGVAGFTVKKFADFEGQMAAVRSVLGKEASPHFKALSDQAKTLGATTAFTAKQAAEAMENLARAGFKPRQIMSSITPVLNAAAAEGMDLATAADIVASNMRAFGLATKDTAMIADTLAFVSAKTNTNMVSLQEGLKFVAPEAKRVGISLQDTAAALGALADVGLKGSIGGTALKNAIIKIAAAAKNGKIQVGKFRVAVVRTSAGGLDLHKTMLRISRAMKAIKDPLKRSQAGMKLLGIRGSAATSGFASLSDKAERVNLLFGKMRDKVLPGTAKRMAAMRLDSIQGDFVRLGSAADGATNAIGQALAPAVRRMIGGVGGLTDQLGMASKAFAFFSDPKHAKDLRGEHIPAIRGVDRSIVGMVKGFLQGVQDIKAGAKTIVSAVKGVSHAFGLGTGESTKGTARLMTKVMGVTVALTGLGLVLKTTSLLFGGLGRVGVGAARMVGAAWTTASAGIAAVLGKITKVHPGLTTIAKKPGLVGKAFKGLDKLTASPVRIVNFEELALMQKLSGTGTTIGTTAALSGMALFRSNLNTAAFGLPIFGTALASSVGGLASFKGGLKGGLMGLGKLGIGLAVAGTAGVLLGRWLDKTFGLSDKISGAIHRWVESLRSATRAQEAAKRQQVIVDANAAQMAKTFAKFAQQGKKEIRVREGKFGEKVSDKKALTREFAEARIKKFLIKQGRGESEIAATLKALNVTLAKIPTALQMSKTVVKIGERTVGSASAKTRQEAKERGAPRVPTRRTAALGATRP